MCAIQVATPATYAQAYLEAAFCDYLQHLVGLSEKSLQVKYSASGCRAAERSFATRSFASASSKAESPQNGTETLEVETPPNPDPGQENVLKLKVQTPEFYTRFVCYSHDIEALFGELTSSLTISVSRPDLLPDLFLKQQRRNPLSIWNPKDYIYFKLIQKLRRLPDSPSAASSGTGRPNTTQVDIRSFRMSSMDAFMISQGHSLALFDAQPSVPRRSYRSVVVRLFLANRFLGGSLALLTMIDLVVHLCMAHVAAMMLMLLMPTG
ncbi:hypothetical protein K4F52_007866 [Lecanicillium sp. MT-2017a]|nr:hypothetical protein K4F52_007866 [Lecanicillium sp. MT-2017a]